MANIKDITSNAVEDGVEDYFSTYIYQRMRSITEPLKANYNSDSPFDEAMLSFVNTMQVGLTMYAMNKVMSFFFERGASLLTSFYTYIVAGKIKKAVSDKLKASKMKGLKAFRFLGAVMGADRTSERIEMTKVVQSNIDSYDRYKMHYENQRDSLENRFDTFSSSVSSHKNSSSNKYLARFNDLTMRGAWTNTSEHKRIYEKALEVDLTTMGVSWSKLSSELNKFTEFYKTANGEVLNLTSAMTKLVTTKGS